MKTKHSLVNVMRRWAFVLLLALASVNIAAYSIRTVNEYKDRVKQMRGRYLEALRQSLKSEVASLINIIDHETEKMIQNAKIRVKVRVSAALAVAENLYEQNRGVRTEDEIKKLIVDALRPIRMDRESGYYFIFDFKGIVQLQADRPDQERISLLNRTDSQGQFVLKDMLDIVKSSGEGFYSYRWSKPGYPDNDHKKLAFVKRFEPFDWLIGTGVYMDDLESHMQDTVLSYTQTRRFGPKGQGYVFVYELLDIQGGEQFATVYANPNLSGDTGKLLSDTYKDAKGKAFRKEFLKGLREKGECYVEYWYKKVGRSEAGPKTSFFKLADNGRFIVAAGSYQEDVEEQIALAKAEMGKSLRNGLLSIGAMFMAAMLIVWLLASLLNKRLGKDLKVFEDCFRLAADASQSIDGKEVKFLEFDRLATFANRMLAQKNTVEQDLKETQARLTQAQEMARVGHYLFEIKNDHWTNSRELDTIFGIGPAFTRNTAGWLGIVHPDFRETMAAHLEDHVLTRHRKFDMEYKIIDRRTGEEKWVHGLGDLSFDDNGNPTEMFGTIQDISERRRLDDSLRLTQFVFDKAAVGIFHIATDGRILNANDKAVASLGYTRDELLSMRIFDIDPNLEPARHSRLWQTLEKNATAQNYIETIHRRKDGTLFPVAVTANLMVYNNEQFTISFVRDITEQKEAKDALKKSEARLSGIVNSMADWVWEVDKDGRYTFCSDNVERVFGYRPEEMMGKVPFDFMTPDEAERVGGIFNEIAGRKRPIRDLENWNIRKDGVEICLLTNGVPILGDTGELLGYRGVDRDITRRKQADKEKRELEARLRQSHKMEAIGTLAGGIAHDFNNILSGILGYSQLAMVNVKTPEQLTRHLEQIIKGIQRASELTKQILTFSRQSEYEKHAFRIYLEIKEAIKLLRSSIPATIEINTRLDSREKVLADPIRIHQVIMNLCTNAYQAMRKTGGCLTVSLTDVTLSDTDIPGDKRAAPGDYVRLEVSDTGHGMDEATLAKAFEPYFTTKEKGDGTGLGLALVQAIVEEHDGFLEVSSQVGSGSRFYLYFPVVKADPETQRRGNVQDRQLKGDEAILLIDDEEQIRESCREFLQSQGYRVAAFSNGSHALERFKKDPKAFDLVISDMTMPGMTGNRFAAQILGIRPEIPVVLCTGFNEDSSREKAKALGIRHYLQKPFLHGDLAALIRDIFDA